MANNKCFEVCKFCYYLKFQVASTCYPQKKLISNTAYLLHVTGLSGRLTAIYLDRQSSFGRVSTCVASKTKVTKTLNNFANSTDTNQTWPRGYKNNFILNSAEHEISNAHEYQNIKKFIFFSDSDKLRMLCFLLINVKMPTIVGILTFYGQENFLAQLS